MKQKAAATFPVDGRGQFEELIRSGALKACERHVAGAHDAQDRIAEGLAMCWVWYSKQVALGRTPDLALVRHCCKLRTVDRSHRLDSGDRRRWQQCVYQVQGRSGVELRRLRLADDADDRLDDDPAVGLAAAGAQDPTPRLDSALDLQRWLVTLSARDRTMLMMRNAGHGLAAIGDKLKCTSSTVHKSCRDLGMELARRAGIEVEPRQRRRGMPRGLTPAIRDALDATP